MRLFLDRDFFDNPKPPRFFLCTTGKKIIQELPSYDESLDGKWGSYSEISFSMDRQYVDVLTGETKIHPAFDKAEGLRKVYVENIGYFVIQDPDTTYSDKDSKTLSCFSSEYETANKYLENFRINTGEIDSKEVIYLETLYGYNYTVDTDNLYKQSLDPFDVYESYYIKDYTDNDSYIYTQVDIANAEVYETYDGSTVAKTLYVKSYPNVRFYWPTKPGLSFLNIVFEKIPGWKIGHVDATLRRKERKFDEDRIAVYDLLMNNTQDTFRCVVEWDTITNTVNFYEEAEDGITEDNTVQTRWDTDIYIGRDNLASSIDINYSVDDIKTKLKVSGSDNLDIREVNLGQNYIMNLSYYHHPEWMESDLYKAYDNYLVAVNEYTPKYTKAMQKWVGVYNKWNDLTNAVPVDGNVVLIGDPFEKLYCVKSPINNAYSPNTITNITTTIDKLYSDYNESNGQYSNEIDKSTLSDGDVFIVQGYEFTYDKANNNFKYIKDITALNLNGKDGLLEKLTLYHVNEDINANNTDNYLLRLKNKNSDIATIRIYNANETGTDEERKNKPDYKIQVAIVYAQSGMSSTIKTYSMDEWIQGKLTAKYINWGIGLDGNQIDLTGYTVQYIGTMGAYFVLAKDETQEATLEEYGVNLLKEKHETYTTIFQTQTEAMFSQEKYQCVAQSTQPEGDFDIGTRWLDTDSSPVVLKEYSADGWKVISAEMSETDQTNYENYQRYIDNYEKMVAVQNVLVKKEKIATYMKDGFKVPNRNINMDLYTLNNGELRYNGQPLEGDMHRAAQAHFGDEVHITRWTYGQALDANLPAYYFTVSSDPIVYGRNTEEFNKNTDYYKKVKNANDVEVFQWILIDGQSVFDSYDGSTEDKTLYVVVSGHTYAVYLQDTVPYVAYADSQGIYRSTMDWITRETKFETFFNSDQWIRLSPFIREDEFSDSNFLLTGYESEEERLEICKELMESASKELKTLCQPSLEFSMDMANILALPEFAPFLRQDNPQFALGNFIRIELRPDIVKRARLLEVHLSFNDLSDFSCSFGNLVTTKSEIDKHAELLSQAVTAGKQVATSAGDWQRAVDKSNKLEQDIANGLQNSALEVGRASGQSIVWDEHGIWGRKLIDGTTDQYHPEQFRIINNKLVFSNDGFKTSKAVFGSYTVNGETRWGPLAEYVTADTIEGKFISGGSIEIGEGDTKFVVDKDGNVSIKVGGNEKYASPTDVTNAIQKIDNAYRFQVVLSYDKSTIFTNDTQDCTITCTVYDRGEDITTEVISIGGKFAWTRGSADANKDDDWNATHIQTGENANKIMIKVGDVEGNSQFSCSVDFDETKLKSDETQTDS